MHSGQIGRPAVVMVSEDAFHLGWMGATRRLFHIAGAFKKLGFEIALVAGRLTNPAVQCDIELQFPGVVMRMNHTGYYPQVIEHSRFLRRAWRAGWKVLGEDMYWSRLSWGWADRLDIEEVCNTLKEHSIRPAVVWGASTGYLAGGVAAQRLAHRLELPWILELHDPPRRAGLGPDNAAVKERFLSLLASTTYVVVTAESYGRLLGAKYALPDEKWRAIHLTYGDSTFPPTCPRQSDFRLVYAGSLNGGRSLGVLVQALAEAFRLWPEMRKSVRLDLAGSGAGFDEVAHLALELGLEENIHFRGCLPGDKIPEFIGSASVVVVVQGKRCKWQVPGKVFESLKSGRPILAIMPRDYEAAQILRLSGLGFVYDPQDVSGIIEAVRRIYESWTADLSIVHPDHSFISEFSLERLPIKIADMLQGFIDLPEPRGHFCEEAFCRSQGDTV